MREPYTWKKVMLEMVTAPFDPELYEELWEGFKKFGYAIVAFIARMGMLLAFPISVPAVKLILDLPDSQQGPWWYMLTGFIISYIVGIITVLVLYT